MKTQSQAAPGVSQRYRELTDPTSTGPNPPARVIHPRYAGDEPERVSHIDPWMEEAFEGLTHASENGAPFALVSGFMNGKPAAIIALAQRRTTTTHIMPLFLAVQPWMKFSGHPEDMANEEPDEDSPG